MPPVRGMSADFDPRGRFVAIGDHHGLTGPGAGYVRGADGSVQLVGGHDALAARCRIGRYLLPLAACRDAVLETDVLGKALAAARLGIPTSGDRHRPAVFCVGGKRAFRRRQVLTARPDAARAHRG